MSARNFHEWSDLMHSCCWPEFTALLPDWCCHFPSLWVTRFASIHFHLQLCLWNFLYVLFSKSFPNYNHYFSRLLKWVTNSFKISFSLRCSICSSLLVHSGQHFSFRRWTTETMRKHFHGEAEDSRRCCYSVQLCRLLQSQTSLEL